MKQPKIIFTTIDKDWEWLVLEIQQRNDDGITLYTEGGDAPTQFDMDRDNAIAMAKSILNFYKEQ